MNCDEARTRWHKRFDGGAKDAELEDHLESCASCREYAGQMDRLVGVLNQLRVETESVVSRPVGPSADERVQTPQRSNWAYARRFMRIAAAVAVLVGGGVLYYSSHRAPVGPGVSPGKVERLDPRIGISLRAETAERFMAVAKPTSEPNVQLYWLYPKMKSKRSDDRS